MKKWWWVVRTVIIILFIQQQRCVIHSALVVDNNPQTTTGQTQHTSTSSSTSTPTVDDGFFMSARTGDIKTLESYLEGEPSLVNARDAKGNSALVIAAGRGQIAAIKLLLKYRASVEDVTQHGLFEGKSALSWAASQGRVDSVAALLQAGANPHRTAEIGVFLGKGPLMWASSQGRADIVRLLLMAGVDVNHSSNIGNFKRKTCLMWASSQGRVETVAVLLEAGADVNAIDDDGVSALMWASGSEVKDEKDHKKGLLEKATKGHIEVVSLLLKYGAHPDMRDRDGITAIMYACYHGHAGAVKALLNAGADADFKNMAGLTAVQLAKKEGFQDAANAILEGPNILSLPVGEMAQVSACGWLLAVLRAPQGTGIFPVRHKSRSLEGLGGKECTGGVCSDHSASGSTSSGGNSGSGTSSSSSRKPTDPIPGANPNTVASSCGVLAHNGLDEALGELLLIVHQAPGGVAEVVQYLGLEQFAARVRATDQLKRLYQAWLGASGVSGMVTDLYGGSVAAGGSRGDRGGRGDGGSTGSPGSPDSGGGGGASGEELSFDQGMCGQLVGMVERHCLGGSRDGGGISGGDGGSGGGSDSGSSTETKKPAVAPRKTGAS